MTPNVHHLTVVKLMAQSHMGNITHVLNYFDLYGFCPSFFFNELFLIMYI